MQMTAQSFKTKYVFILVIISLFLFALFWSTNKGRQFSASLDSKANTQNPDVTTPSSDSETDDNGYVTFTQKSFESNMAKCRVLFFYANWCTTCRPVNADFLKNPNQLPDDVVVYRVNYRDSDTDESEKELAEKYKITYQHTFVQVNQQGEVIKKWNGGNLAELIKKVN